MRIAIVHTHFLNWMGSTKFIFEVAKRLRKRSDVDIFCHQASPYARNRFKEIGCNLIEFSHVSSYSKKYWAFLPYYLRKDVNALAKRAHEYDVFLATFFPMNWVATRLRKRAIYFCWEPFVWFHDPAALHHNQSPLMRLSIMGCKLLYNHYDLEGTRNCEKVLTLSNFMASRIERIYGLKAVVSREGVDTNLFQRKLSPELKEKYSKLKIILHSTNLGYTKRTDFLVEALPLVKNKVPQFRLLIMCTRNDVLARAKIERRAREIGVYENIEFLPFLEEEQLPYYFSLADVVVQPSLNEAASLPIKEAMACSTPVIGSYGDGSEEDIADSGSGFLVHQGNVGELAERIITILSNRALAMSMGVKGRERVTNIFSWERVVDSIWRAIDESRSDAR